MRLDLISTIQISPLGPTPSTSARRPLASGTSAKQQKSCTERNSRITPRCTLRAVGDCRRSTIGGRSAIGRERLRKDFARRRRRAARRQGAEGEQAGEEQRQADYIRRAYPE